MNTYKITNITNLIGKREKKYNSVLDIEYVDKMTKKIIKVNAGETIYLSIQTLPLSVQSLRVKGLITVTEVDPIEINVSKPKPVEKKTVVDVEEKKIEIKPITKKKTRKEEESENE